MLYHVITMYSCMHLCEMGVRKREVHSSE